MTMATEELRAIEVRLARIEEALDAVLVLLDGVFSREEPTGFQQYRDRARQIPTRKVGG